MLTVFSRGNLYHGVALNDSRSISFRGLEGSWLFEHRYAWPQTSVLLPSLRTAATVLSTIMDLEIGVRADRLNPAFLTMLEILPPMHSVSDDPGHNSPAEQCFSSGESVQPIPLTEWQMRKLKALVLLCLGLFLLGIAATSGSRQSRSCVMAGAPFEAGISGSTH
jgi:hypothetical protein